MMESVYCVFIHLVSIGFLFFQFSFTCADPDIFMRGGPTRMVIFGHRRGGSNPPKIPKLPFFLGKI